MRGFLVIGHGIIGGDLGLFFFFFFVLLVRKDFNLPYFSNILLSQYYIRPRVLGSRGVSGTQEISITTSVPPTYPKRAWA